MENTQITMKKNHEENKWELYEGETQTGVFLKEYTKEAMKAANVEWEEKKAKMLQEAIKAAQEKKTTSTRAKKTEEKTDEE